MLMPTLEPIVLLIHKNSDINNTYLNTQQSVLTMQSFIHKLKNIPNKIQIIHKTNTCISNTFY